MRSAEYDATGSWVRVTFDQPVAMHSAAQTRVTRVNCASIFADSTQLLGSGAMCKLQNSTTLEIVLSSGATLVPSYSSVGDCSEANTTLTLLDGRVRSLSDESVDAVGCVGVAPPSNAKPPVAKYVYQDRIGVCADLNIDAAMSVAASGGRPLEFTWAVEFADRNGPIRSHIDSSILGSASSVTVMADQIPGAATNILVMLNLRSKLFGTQSATIVRVERALDELPSVEISAQSVSLQQNEFSIETSGSIPACANGTLTPAFTYSWEMFSSTAQDTWTVVDLEDFMQRDLVSYTNKRESGMRFAAHTLKSCTTYRFKCTVGYSTVGNAEVSNWQTHEVVIQQGEIVALISGNLEVERSQNIFCYTLINPCKTATSTVFYAKIKTQIMN